MPVTSDSLFHFTSSLKNLQSILYTKFKLTFCNETYILSGEEHQAYFPMVSFCDLPLSLTKDHIFKYGNYAVGLSKEWGIKNKLNPVIYVERESIVANDLQTTLDSLTKLLGNYNAIQSLTDKHTEIDLKDFKENLKNNASSSINAFRYLKNYQGELKRGSKVLDKKYRFYDEREWRYVPAFNDKRVKSHLEDDEYLKYRGSSKSKPLVENIILNFLASDIKYLIVKSSKDIPKLIRFIKSTNDLTKNSDEGDILTTKIITVDQLNKDF